MVLSSIGILKAQRKRGEKKNTDFLFIKKYLKISIYFKKEKSEFFFFLKIRISFRTSF